MNFQDKHGLSPLDSALFNDRADLVRYLLEHGANPNLKGQYRLAPLEVARVPDEVRLLLRYGADITARDSDGGSALQALVGFRISGELSRSEDLAIEESVRILLEHGADPYQVDNMGRTPISVARDAGYTHLVALLVRYANPGHRR